METKVSLQCSQQPTTGPYPEPDESRPHLHSLTNKKLTKEIKLN